MIWGDGGMQGIEELMATYIVGEECVHSRNKRNATNDTQRLHKKERAFQNHDDSYRVMQPIGLYHSVH